jgi:predicted RNase H-like nuclease
VTALHTSRYLIAAGIDGCRGGWVCAGWDGESWSLDCLPTLGSFVPMLAPRATVCIDIPIGLSSDGFRACDRAARQLLGKRSSSVFPVPPRLALAPLTYEEINLASKAQCGKGVSKQAFYLLPKIRETEALLRSSYANDTDWLETHPELCFSSFNGAMPMEENKKTDPGFRERKSVLARHIPARTIDRLLRDLMASVPRAQCARDDMLDALVCGVVARLDAAGRGCLPPGGQEFDEEGLPMRICYPIPTISQ